MKKLDLEGLMEDDISCQVIVSLVWNLDFFPDVKKGICNLFSRKCLELILDVEGVHYKKLYISQNGFFEANESFSSGYIKNRNKIDKILSYYWFDDDMDNSGELPKRYFLRYKENESKQVTESEFKSLLKLLNLNPETCIGFGNNCEWSGWIEEKQLVHGWKWVKL